MPADSPLPKRFLLASVLKPVDDTRMRDKFAQTLLSWPLAEVHVAGRDTGGDLQHTLAEDFPRVMHHRIFWGARLSVSRLAAQARYWRLLRIVKPELVIVHAPELLPLTLLWRALGRGRQFAYDIRENYALNVGTQQVYQGWLKRGLAAGLRWVEGLAARRAAAVFLAEASYADELPFLAPLPPGRVLVLENKYQPGARGAPPRRRIPGRSLTLCLAGRRTANYHRLLPAARFTGLFEWADGAAEYFLPWPDYPGWRGRTSAPRPHRGRNASGTSWLVALPTASQHLALPAY
jgi:glycogen(starch) synthase